MDTQKDKLDRMIDLVLDAYLVYDKKRDVYFVPRKIYHDHFVPSLKKHIQEEIDQ